MTFIQTLWMGGTGRCGTTFVRRALGEHPDIWAIPRETKPPGERHLFRKWKDRVLLDARSKADEKGAWVVIEKTPRNALLSQELLLNMPRSIYLHVSTGDRERQIDKLMAKAAPVPGFGYFMHRADAAAYYDFAETRYRSARERFPKRCHSITLVDLANDWAGTLQRVCDWAGIGELPEHMTESRIDPERLGVRRPSSLMA